MVRGITADIEPNVLEVPIYLSVFNIHGGLCPTISHELMVNLRKVTNKFVLSLKAGRCVRKV